MFLDESHDWDIDADGLYVATRGFLVRRGYCCANRCRNCPYINWREQEMWQPAPAEAVQFALVAAKALEAARQRLAFHEQELQHTREDDTRHDYHQMMAEHYRVLMTRWQAA